MHFETTYISLHKNTAKKNCEFGEITMNKILKEFGLDRPFQNTEKNKEQKNIRYLMK